MIKQIFKTPWNSCSKIVSMSRCGWKRTVICFFMTTTICLICWLRSRNTSYLKRSTTVCLCVATVSWKEKYRFHQNSSHLLRIISDVLWAYLTYKASRWRLRIKCVWRDWRTWKQRGIWYGSFIKLGHRVCTCRWLRKGIVTCGVQFDSRTKKAKLQNQEDIFTIKMWRVNFSTILIFSSFY